MGIQLLLAPSIGSARAKARAELLSRSLAGLAGEDVDITMADSYSELAAQAEAGSAELVWAPPSVCAKLQRSLVRSLFKCVRRGRSTYRSALVVRRGEEEGGVERFRGSRVAWVDRLSFGGRLLAVAYLEGAGYDTSTFFREQTFTGSYPNAIRAVVYENADITAVSVPDQAMSSVEASLATYGGKVHAERLAPLAITDETPNDALVLTNKLSEDHALALSRRLFGTTAIPEAPASLCMALDAEGFERAEIDEYRRVRELLLHATVRRHG